MNSCPSRKSYPHIAMVQSGKNWRGDDRSVPLDSSPSRKTERGEGCLHSKGAVAQQIKILHRASSVADLQLDAIPCKYSSVLPRKVVVPRPCHPGRDHEVTWRYRIDEAIGHV